MTARATFTQASVLRAIAALEKAGKRVAGVRADGTVLVDNGHEGVPLAPNADDNAPKLGTGWENI